VLPILGLEIGNGTVSIIVAIQMRIAKADFRREHLLGMTIDRSEYFLEIPLQTRNVLSNNTRKYTMLVTIGFRIMSNGRVLIIARQRSLVVRIWHSISATYSHVADVFTTV
jgi:hypothetical protein